VIQKTETLFGTIIHVALSNKSSVTHVVDPLISPNNKLTTIKSGADLRQVQIRRGDDKTSNLIPNDVSDDDCSAGAKTVAQLLQVKDALSKNTEANATKSSAPRAVSASKSPAIVISGSTNVSFGEAIELAFSDLMNFVKRA
jgi:hypothetical protein